MSAPVGRDPSDDDPLWWLAGLPWMAAIAVIVVGLAVFGGVLLWGLLAGADTDDDDPLSCDDHEHGGVGETWPGASVLLCVEMHRAALCGKPGHVRRWRTYVEDDGGVERLRLRGWTIDRVYHVAAER